MNLKMDEKLKKLCEKYISHSEYLMNKKENTIKKNKKVEDIHLLAEFNMFVDEEFSDMTFNNNIKVSLIDNALYFSVDGKLLLPLKLLKINGVTVNLSDLKILDKKDMVILFEWVDKVRGIVFALTGNFDLIKCDLNDIYRELYAIYHNNIIK